jgi:hypothetical protein
VSLLLQKIRGKEGKRDLGIAFSRLEQPTITISNEDSPETAINEKILRDEDKTINVQPRGG